MKKILFISLGIVVIFLFVLSFISVEVISKPAHPYCWTLKPGGLDPCWDRPTNCFCYYDVLPPGGAQ